MKTTATTIQIAPIAAILCGRTEVKMTVVQRLRTIYASVLEPRQNQWGWGGFMGTKLTIEVEAMLRDYLKASGEFFGMLDSLLFSPLEAGARPTREQIEKLRILTNALQAKNDETARAMKRFVN